MARNRNSSWRRPLGVTLLELLLALALSVVVLSAIGMAINLHFKMLDFRRTSIEEIQVVQNVTRIMTNDIRGMVNPYKPDLSGLKTVMQNSMAAANAQVQAATGATGTIIGAGNNSSGGSTGGSAGAQGTGGGQGGGGQNGQGGGANANNAGATGQGAQGGGGQSGQAAGGTSSGGAAAGGAASGSGSGGGAPSSSTDSSSSTTSAAAGTVVKLVGTAAELRIDISRLPRVDQYKGMMTSKGELSTVDLPSDVKTICYFLRSESSAASFGEHPETPGGEASTDGFGRGLMRAELDRAVASYADTNGGSVSVYDSAQLLADEVVGLGFEYFDGTEWPAEWDSDALGALPRAIRVWLSIKPTYGMSEQEMSQAAQGKQPAETDFYFVISLPTAPLVATPATTETDTSAAASTSSSTGTATQGTTP